MYLRLERSNGTLTWCRPPWSALKAGHSSSQPDYMLSANPEDMVSPGLLMMVCGEAVEGVREWGVDGILLGVFLGVILMG